MCSTLGRIKPQKRCKLTSEKAKQGKLSHGCCLAQPLRWPNEALNYPQKRWLSFRPFCLLNPSLNKLNCDLSEPKLTPVSEKHRGMLASRAACSVRARLRVDEIALTKQPCEEVWRLIWVETLTRPDFHAKCFFSTSNVTGPKTFAHGTRQCEKSHILVLQRKSKRKTLLSTTTCQLRIVLI